jgi:hypothetical protein
MDSPRLRRWAAANPLESANETSLPLTIAVALMGLNIPDGTPCRKTFVPALLFPGLIQTMIEPDKERLVEDVDRKQRELDGIAGLSRRSFRAKPDVESKLLKKNLAGIVTEDQFDYPMTEYKGKREWRWRWEAGGDSVGSCTIAQRTPNRRHFPYRHAIYSSKGDPHASLVQALFRQRHLCQGKIGLCVSQPVSR